MSISETPHWLMLIHQLPAKPAYALVKVWRRLQALGAVTVKGSVYALLANGETREVAARLRDEPADNVLADSATQAARLRKQLDAVVAIDFFGAEARATAEGLVSGLEAALKQEEDDMPDSKTAAVPPAGALKDRTWVTRQGVQVDRIASAWLISRFIDPGARFKFVPGTDYAPEPGELRFDMFEGKFRDVGD